jgi:hypothetical protein
MGSRRAADKPAANATTALIRRRPCNYYELIADLMLHLTVTSR